MRKRCRIVGLPLFCAILIAISVGVEGTVQADFWNNAPGTSHWYNYASHKCLRVLTEAAEPGFPVDQYDCRNAAAQEWERQFENWRHSSPWPQRCRDNCGIRAFEPTRDSASTTLA